MNRLERIAANDAIAIAALAVGRLRVDADGSIWRVKRVVAANGHGLFACTPKRCDAPTKAGYRRVTVGQHGFVMAHRVVWIAANGPIPPGLEVNHKNGVHDDNRLDNLELVTPSGNVQHARDVLGVNYAVGERVGTSKLTEAQATEAIRLLSAGARHKDIAAQLGVDGSTITRIATGERWAHLPRPVSSEGAES